MCPFKRGVALVSQTRGRLCLNVGGPWRFDDDGSVVIIDQKVGDGSFFVHDQKARGIGDGNIGFLFRKGCVGDGVGVAIDVLLFR